MKCHKCKKEIKGKEFKVQPMVKLQIEVDDLIYCEECFNKLIK